MSTTNTTSITSIAASIINVTGSDAAKFLQGQLTCDVDKLPLGQSSYCTANTPQGRTYGLFRIIKTEDGFLLKVEPSTVDNVIQTLGKYSIFFKCHLSVDAQYTCYGIMTDASNSEWMSDPEHAINEVIKKDHGYLIRLPSSQNRFEYWSTDSNLKANTSADIWSQLETRDGIPELYQSTAETFIPQMLNLQELGAISYTKGCYTGQEIIARMHYLGKLKKKMYLLKASKKCLLEPGADLFDQQANKCGTVVRCHPVNQDHSILLAVLNITFTESGQPAYTSADRSCSLSVRELNYLNQDPQ